LDVDPLASPSIVKTTEYPAYNLYGFSFSTVWHGIEGHGEAALHDTLDNEMGEDYLPYIFGVTYINYSLLPDVFEEIGFIIEYAGETVLEEREPGSNYVDQSTSRGLSANIIGTIEFKINDDHLLESAFMYNFNDKDSILDFNGRSRLNDHLEIRYGYQNLSGDAATFIGQWDANDRFYVKMSITY